MRKMHTLLTQRTRQAMPPRHSASGKNGVALAPPTYGIDFVDQHALSNQPAHALVASAPTQNVGSVSGPAAQGGKGDPGKYLLLAGSDPTHAPGKDARQEPQRRTKRHRLRPVISLVHHGSTSRAQPENDEQENVLHAGLGANTVAGPTAGDNGNYSWTIQWVLDSASAKGGWVIQKIDISFNVQDEHGTAINVSTKGVDTKKIPYWEAWKINAGKKITTYAEGGDTADDTYVSSINWGDKTKGTVRVTGAAEFYEDLTLPSDFKATHPYAGILPATTNDPGALSGGTGSMAHNLTATWDSTGGNKKTTVTTTP